MNLMNPPSSIDDLLKLLDILEKYTIFGESDTHLLKLLKNLSNIADELLNLLDVKIKFLLKVESLLTRVDQRPCDSTRSALQPVMKALIKNELLSHTNEDVKVSVVFCVTELSRITAPKHPYDDHEQMEEILRHTVMVLKKLSDVAGRSFRKVVQILDTVAQLRSCVILLDLEYDTLVIYIFKLFLTIIRPYHPHKVFTRMKEIMIQLIEGIDELSVELLQPLLASVKNENQMAEPISSKLGEKVLEHCAVTVKPYLVEALKSMSLNPDACHEIVASICKMPTEKEMVKYVDGHVDKLNLQNEGWDMIEDNSSQKMADENAPDTGHPVKVGSSKVKFCEPAPQDDTHREKIIGTCRSSEMSHGSLGHLDQPKKNETLKSEDHLDMLVVSGDATESQVKKRGSLHLGLTGGERNKHTICTKRKSGKGSRKNESASNCEAECKTEFIIEGEELTLQQIREMKQKKEKTTIKIHDSDESGEKADTETAQTAKLSVRDDTYLDKCVDYKPRKKMTTGKNEDSKRPPTIKSCGKELVGARIKVWWPLDKKFYEGAVSSFDPEKRKHTIKYDDGDIEKLNLHKHRWEFLEDNLSKKDLGLDSQSHVVSSATFSKKKAKRNSSTEPNISLSKRSKSTAK